MTSNGVIHVIDTVLLPNDVKGAVIPLAKKSAENESTKN